MKVKPTAASAALVAVALILGTLYLFPRRTIRHANANFNELRGKLTATYGDRAALHKGLDWQCRGAGVNRTAFVNNHWATGYVIAGSFVEQQTRGASNLATLQCWAKTIPMYVVEPFMRNSRLLTPMSGAENELLRFSDVFDADNWNAVTNSRGYAPLASWEQFLLKAPRQVILVNIKYARKHHAGDKKGIETTHHQTAFSTSYKHGCTVNATLRNPKLKYLSNHGFHIIREVCFNFNNAGASLTKKQFNEHLFATYNFSEVTVFLNTWKGLNDHNRVRLKISCNTTLATTYLRPSERPICDAKRYHKKFIKTDNYIALVVRTEKIGLYHQASTKKYDRATKFDAKYTSKCLNAILAKWRSVKRTKDIRTTFMSADIGKYGSDSVNAYGYKALGSLYETFMKDVYGPFGSVQAWEERFESVTAVREPGYIALMQKILSIHARCVIFVGGGSFQKNAMELYERLHPNNKCIHFIKECSKNLY